MPSSRKLIQFYNHLSRTLEAGLSLPAALESAPVFPAELSAELSRELYQGSDTREAFSKAGEFLPKFDLALLQSAAETGRLAETFQSLVEHHELKLATNRAIIGMLAYPMILLHLGALLFPILSLVDLDAGGVQWSMQAYLERTFGLLGGIWAALAFCWAFFSADAPAIYRIRLWIPIFRGFQKHQAMSRFSFALGSMLDAGISPSRAWLRSGRLSTDPDLEAAAREIANGIEAGNQPGKMLGRFPLFSKEFIAFYLTGESTGSLVETLQRQGALYAERSRDSLKLLGKILPTLILAIVVGTIGFVVVQTYAAYFQQISDMLP